MKLRRLAVAAVLGATALVGVATRVPAATKPPTLQASGRITKVDLHGNRVAIRSGRRTTTFVTSSKTVVRIRSKAARLASLRVGEQATVTYLPIANILLATRVVVAH